VENQEKVNDDPFANEVEDSEPLDEESQKALNNVNNFNIDSFTKSNDKHDKNKQKAANKKPKNNKGVDFMEYAQKNGINVSIQYEENAANSQKKAANKKDNNFTSQPQTNQSNQYQKKGGKNKKYQKSHNTEGNNLFQNPYKLGSNKFDAYNSGFMMGGMFPQNFMRHEMPQHQYQMNNVNQDFQKLTFDESTSSDVTPDKKIIDSLEYYFSIENLNKDSFIRGKLNEDGYLDADAIINFNQYIPFNIRMKKNAVTVEKLKELLKQFDTIIETKTEDEKIYLRNKNWETIRDVHYNIIVESHSYPRNHSLKEE
jgi:la-related protein 1